MTQPSSVSDAQHDAEATRSKLGLGRLLPVVTPPRGPHHTRGSDVLHWLGEWSSRSVAGVTVACLLAVWTAVGIVAGFPSWWELGLYSTTAGVTVVMVFVIQHTQHREQLVTQRKLDELVRAQPGADDRLIAAEAATDAELDRLIIANERGPRSTSAPDVRP